MKPLSRPVVKLSLGFLCLLVLMAGTTAALGSRLPAGVVAFARGTENTLYVTLAALSIALVLGVSLGALAGLGSALGDALLSRAVELCGALPAVVLLAIVRASEPIPAGTGFVLTLGVLRGIEMARLLRGEVLRVSGQDFVMAARALGVGSVELFFRHLLPHALGPLLVSGAFTAAQVIGLDSALGMLGLGGTTTWGGLVAAAAVSGRPAAAIAPALGAALTTAALYVLGDAIDDARSARRRRAWPRDHGTKGLAAQA